MKNCTFLFVFLIHFKSPHSENCAGKRIKIINLNIVGGFHTQIGDLFVYKARNC